ncbi:GTP cyclohydrolase I FolE [Lentisphaera marina]|uniref:GTP cyclohydrolase I FolE n=1 Tax=Lentisphaera marina TaxID=1111041 RepID=UPI002365D864|nr:GTP cyclohydrolase I FolE [Lentisphaera marina]MDD7986511.1 GTP cyclohydrolase I FolE [Lentisphaera marina]
MLDTSKTDTSLGHEVEAYLASKGQSTPLINNTLSNKEKVKKIESLFSEIMETLGLDLNDDSLMESPSRVAKMYVNEIFQGLNPDNFPKCTAIENKMAYDEMVTVSDIKVMSNCEHHFVVIDGFAHISYIPNKKVIGLSKINRIVDYFSRRPQVQERLTHQIFHTLCYILDTQDVAVVIDATHYCVKSRGVQDASSRTSTSKIGGKFKRNPATRAEFFSQINKK